MRPEALSDDLVDELLVAPHLPLASATFPDPHPILDAADHATLMSVMAEAVMVRRRYEFFVWAQVRLQAVLPHDVLVCGLPRNQSARMLFDYYFSVPVDPEALARLCHPRDGLANDLVDRWIGDGYEPLMVSRDSPDEAISRLGDEMGALGFGDCLVHGIPKAQAAASAHCFFAFVSLKKMDDPRLLPRAQMLVPHVFGAYSRAQTRERPVAEVENPDNPDASITHREVEILRWIREGKSNLEIGMILSISPLTVKNHVQKILRKLNATNRAQAVSKAISMKLLGSASMRDLPAFVSTGATG